jgi:adenylate cyclase class 2
MTEELEVKFKVDTHDDVRAALTSAGAACIRRVLETNHILDAKDGALRAAGAALRVRERHTVDTQQRDSILTYKGPVQPSQFKRREEREVTVGDTDAALLILDRIGFVPVLVYEKRRESWRLADCTIELDEVPHLGCFVEIEGPTEQAINRSRQQLGLDTVAPTPQTYVGLLASYCHEHRIIDRRIMFPHRPPATPNST